MADSNRVRVTKSSGTSSNVGGNATKKRGISRRTFDTLEALKKGDNDLNMYEIVYSRGKNLKDDKRLAYYSFLTVLGYMEVIYLGLFSVTYTCASGIDM